MLEREAVRACIDIHQITLQKTCYSTEVEEST
jgi:hypothetical protein